MIFNNFLSFQILILDTSPESSRTSDVPAISIIPLPNSPNQETTERSEDLKHSDISSIKDKEELNDEPPQKVPRSGRIYHCPRCTYVTDRKTSLTRHIRIHTDSSLIQSEDARKSEPPPGRSEDVTDRFCKECNIQFSSMNTFMVHKELYCQSRHRNAPRTETKHSQPYFCLPTNPLIILPYSIMQTAQILPEPILPDNAYIVSPDGTVRNVALLREAEAAISPSSTSPAETDKAEQEEPTATTSETPLDLSRKQMKLPFISVRKDISKIPESELSRALKSVSPRSSGDKISPNPRDIEREEHSNMQDSSTKSSPTLSQGSPRSPNSNSNASLMDLAARLKSESRDDKTSPTIPPIPPGLMGPLWHPGHMLGLPPLSPLLFPHLASLGALPIPPTPNGVRMPDPTAPPMLIKQGVSKCRECNIVFYKHENYLVHKKHYCASREEVPGAVEIKEEQISEEHPKSEEDTNPDTPLLQFICTACGVKFGSPDNLKVKIFLLFQK